MMRPDQIQTLTTLKGQIMTLSDAKKSGNFDPQLSTYRGTLKQLKSQGRIEEGGLVGLLDTLSNDATSKNPAEFSKECTEVLARIEKAIGPQDHQSASERHGHEKSASQQQWNSGDQQKGKQPWTDRPSTQTSTGTAARPEMQQPQQKASKKEAKNKDAKDKR